MLKAIETMNGTMTVEQEDVAITTITGLESAVSVKTLIDALCDVLDGHSDHDIVGLTGLSLDRAQEIIAIRNAVKEIWMKG